jgi:hypothetical protein
MSDGAFERTLNAAIEYEELLPLAQGQVFVTTVFNFEKSRAA